MIERRDDAAMVASLQGAKPRPVTADDYRTPVEKRPPGRPRKPPASVAPEQLGPYTEKARTLIDDEPALIKWLNERRMVAIVALGETLADPKLFLEVTDDLLKELKEIAEAGKRAKKR
jgi:hypothetical protein